MARRMLLPLLPLLLAGCILDTGRCNYEHRSLVLNGKLSDRSATTALVHTVELSLNESRGANPDSRTFNASVRTPLYLQVQRVELAELIGQDTTVLATWNTGNTTQPGHWYANQDLLTSQPSHERLQWRAEVAGLVVMVSLFGEPRRLTARLQVQEDGGWERPYCS